MHPNGTDVDVDALQQFVGGTVEGEIRRTTDNGLINTIFTGRVKEVGERNKVLRLVIESDDKENQRLLPLHSAWSFPSDDDMIVFVPGYGPTVRKLTFSPPK